MRRLYSHGTLVLAGYLAVLSKKIESDRLFLIVLSRFLHMDIFWRLKNLP